MVVGTLACGGRQASIPRTGARPIPPLSLLRGEDLCWCCLEASITPLSHTQPVAIITQDISLLQSSFLFVEPWTEEDRALGECSM